MSEIRSLSFFAIVTTFSTVGNGATIGILMNSNPVPIENYSIINDRVNPPSIYIRKPPTFPYPYVIYCYDSNGEPSDINTIGTQLDPQYIGHVRIRVYRYIPSGIGARNVNQIYLDRPSGSYYSEVIQSKISGDLGSVTVFKNSSGNGGEIDFSGGLGGNVTGVLTCYRMSQLIAAGNLASDAHIIMSGPMGSGITFGGDILGRITLPQGASNTIQADGNITGQITIDNFTGNIAASNLTPANIFSQPNIDISPRCGETITWTVGGRALVCNVCLPSPADGQQDVVTWPLLAWKPASNAVRHKLYFGTTDGSPAYVDDLAEGWYEPGRLPTDTTYYWRVDEVADDDTVTTGPQWSFTTTAGDPIIVRVDDNVASPQTPMDGSTWERAYSTLSAALAAVQNETHVEVWIAKGTYRPDASDRTKSFELKSGVAIYGGFPDGQTGAGTFDARHVELYETILSGDLDQNDSTLNDDNPFENMGNNSYHVVTASQVDNTAILDGVTITGGNADDGGSSSASADLRRGGGLLNLDGSPRIQHCVFKRNRARGGGTTTNQEWTEGGGGICNVWRDHNSETNRPLIRDCRFERNIARCGGGMLNLTGSEPTVMNCVFVRNGVEGGATGSEFNQRLGGGVMNGWNATPIPHPHSVPRFINCVFSGNAAEMGGGMYNLHNDPVLTNCTFWNNEANTTSGSDPAGGGGIVSYDDADIPRLTNCILWGNRYTLNPSINKTHQQMFRGTLTSITYTCIQDDDPDDASIPFGGSEKHNIDDDPLFLATTGDGNLRLQDGSPCKDTGDNTAVWSSQAVDLDGLGRIGASGTVDRGPYERTEPRIVSALSRKTHGAQGSFTIDVREGQRIECRKDGPTRLEFTFDQEVVLSGLPDNGDVTLSSGTVDDISLSEGTLTVTLSGVTANSELTGEFPGVVSPLGGYPCSSTLCMANLLGDANEDNAVNIFDLVAVRDSLNAPVVSTNYRRDVNADGSINIFDLVHVRNNLNTTVARTCPAPTSEGGCEPDPDQDGILADGDDNGLCGTVTCAGGETEDCDDNCPDDYNPDQADWDSNGLGDACDPFSEPPGGEGERAMRWQAAESLREATAAQILLRAEGSDEDAIELPSGGELDVELWVDGGSDISLVEGRLWASVAGEVSVTDISWNVTPTAETSTIVGMSLPAGIERPYGNGYVTDGVLSLLPVEPLTAGLAHIGTVTIHVTNEPGTYLVRFAAGFVANGNGEVSWLHDQPALSITVKGE